MRSTSPAVPTGLTLAFELAALRELADPQEAVATARGWSEHVGVVTDRPPYVLTKFTRDSGIVNDFPPEPTPAAETLSHMHSHHDTERYVLVTADGGDETTDGVENWERLPLAEAVERTDWELADEGTTSAGRESPGPDRHTSDSVDSEWP